MAKKFVRGVTGVEDIKSFDKTLTNVNDLISDGQDTYVHTKKGEKELYYKLTDGVKSVKSNNSKINIEKSNDGTVNLSTNPQKVLEHDNLIAGDYLTKTSSGNTTTLKVSDEFVNIVNGKQKLKAGDGITMIDDTISLKSLGQYHGDLNQIAYTCIAKPEDNSPNLPKGVSGNGILLSLRVDDVVIQKYHPFTGNQLYIRSCTGLGSFGKPPGRIHWSDWTLLS